MLKKDKLEKAKNICRNNITSIKYADDEITRNPDLFSSSETKVRDELIIIHRN